jgi:hypothetical protein
MLGAKIGAKSVTFFWQQNGEIFDQHFTAAPPKLFFSLENQFFYTTLIQLPMAGLKIKFLKKKLTGWLSCLPQKGQKGTFWTPLRSNILRSALYATLDTYNF